MPSNINAILWMACAYVCCGCGCGSAFVVAVAAAVIARARIVAVVACLAAAVACLPQAAISAVRSHTTHSLLSAFVCLYAWRAFNKRRLCKGQNKDNTPTRLLLSSQHAHKLSPYVRLLLLLLLLAWLSFCRFCFCRLSLFLHFHYVVVFAGFCVCFIKTSGAILKQLYLGLPLG